MTRNKRWFLGQAILLLLIIFSPFRIELIMPTPTTRFISLILILLGISLTIFASISLKENMKASPKPRKYGHLITTGAYKIIRHPAYSGILLAALGISLWRGDLIRGVLTLALFVFFDIKTKEEEGWLLKTYPQYDSYKKQVTKKFIPWIY